MSDIAFDTVGRAGLITLLRPKALNALTRDMVLAMGEALAEWARDDRVERVVVRAEGKAFCAGGDIRAMYFDRGSGVEFFHEEYRLNHRVHEFPKPYVALMDGVAMGGGVGISLHGSHRVGGENVLIAMPEVGIGLFPDVGASHVLSRMEGGAGRHLALTGTRLGRDEAAALGLVTHPTASERLGDALDRTAHARDLDRALGELTVETEPREKATAAMIAEAFAAEAETVAAVLDRLDEAAADSEFAFEAARAIRRASPTSLAVTNRQLARAADASFDEVIRTDFRIASRVLEGHDFFEGIRAAVIDKDRTPRWSPAELSGVDEDDVAAYFEAPEHGDIRLP